VIIEAVVGNGYQGDIAIDDISFTPDCQPTGNGTIHPETSSTSSVSIIFYLFCSDPRLSYLTDRISLRLVGPVGVLGIM